MTQPVLLVSETVVGGAFAGLVIGLSDALSRRQNAQIRAERGRLDVLNRMLRHHLLNGMDIILASADGETGQFLLGFTGGLFRAAVEASETFGFLPGPLRACSGWGGR